jgi:ankyrin repeat protein
MDFSVLPDDHPYFASCRQGQLSEIEGFFRNGISVYACGDCLESPALIYAIDQRNTQFLDLLIRYGLDVNLRNGELQMNALLMAMERRDLVTARFLIERGAEVNASNLAELTPFLYAAAIGDVEFLEYLLGAGAFESAADCRGRNALGYACEENCLGAAKWLFERGAVVNVRYGDGECPLIVATKKNRPLIVEWLLSVGADRSAVDNDGKAAADFAKELKFDEVKKILSAADGK